MRFTADCKGLAGPLGLALEASKRGPVRCEAAAVAATEGAASAGTLTLTGTDGELGVRVSVDAEVETEGSCLLPAKVGEILKDAAGEVVISSGKTLIVSINGDLFELAGEEDAGVFEMPDAPAPPSLATTAGELLTAIDRSAFAAAKETDAGGYVKRAVALEVAKKGAWLQATCGKRLAVAELGDGEFAVAGVSLLPPRAVKLIRELVAGCEEAGSVQIVLQANDAFVTTPKGSVYTRLVEGRPPPYREVIPKKGGTVVTLESDAFCRAVKRAALTSDVESRRVECQFSEDGILLKAEGQPGRSAVAHKPLAHSGPPVVVTFDPDLLADVGRLGDTVTLSILGPDRSVVFRAPGCLMAVVPLV